MEKLCNKVQRDFLCGTCVVRRPLSGFRVSNKLEDMVRVGLAKRTEDRDAMLMVLIFTYLWTVLLFQLL